jgi:4-carboxymuconolactone decarboxylase
MPRLREITSRTELPQDKQHIFDSIAESRGRVWFPFSLLLNSPEVAGRVAHLGSYLRFESVLSPAHREIAILTAARESDCAFEWAAHARLGAEAGVRSEAVDVIGRRGPLSALKDEETLIVGYGRELLRDHRVSEATFEAARARYGDQGVTELTAIMGYYTMLACALNAFQAEPPPDWARLP